MVCTHSFCFLEYNIGAGGFLGYKTKASPSVIPFWKALK